MTLARLRGVVMKQWPTYRTVAGATVSNTVGDRPATVAKQVWADDATIVTSGLHDAQRWFAVPTDPSAGSSAAGGGIGSRPDVSDEEPTTFELCSWMMAPPEVGNDEREDETFAIKSLKALRSNLLSTNDLEDGTPAPAEDPSLDHRGHALRSAAGEIDVSMAPTRLELPAAARIQLDRLLGRPSREAEPTSLVACQPEPERTLILSADALSQWSHVSSSPQLASTTAPKRAKAVLDLENRFALPPAAGKAETYVVRRSRGLVRIAVALVALCACAVAGLAAAFPDQACRVYRSMIAPAPRPPVVVAVRQPKAEVKPPVSGSTNSETLRKLSARAAVAMTRGEPAHALRMYRQIAALSPDDPSIAALVRILDRNQGARP